MEGAQALGGRGGGGEREGRVGLQQALKDTHPEGEGPAIFCCRLLSSVQCMDFVDSTVHICLG